MVNKLLVQVTVCTLLFVFILNTFEKEAKVTNEFDLNKMNEVVIKHNGKITEWSIFAREELTNIDTQQLEEIFSQLMSQFPQFLWTKDINSDRINITGTVSDQSLRYVENLQIVANLNEKNIIHGFILYEIKGTKWNKNVQHVIKVKLDDISSNIFHKTTVFFSCLKGEFGDKIDGVIAKKSKEMVNDFKGKIIEKLEEKDFTSLTVQSPYFSYEMQTENGSFNVQIALRENGIDEKTTFVIGTPIITIEY